MGAESRNGARDIEALLGGAGLSNSAHKESLRKQLFGGRRELAPDELELVAGGVATDAGHSRIDAFLQTVKKRGISKQAAKLMIFDQWEQPGLPAGGESDEYTQLEKHVDEIWDHFN